MTDFSVGLTSDGWRLLRGRLAFTGAAGFGLAGTAINVFVTTGQVELDRGYAYISETLVSVSDLGTIALGLNGGNTGQYVEAAQSVVGAGTFAAGSWWHSLGNPNVSIHGNDFIRYDSVSGTLTPKAIGVNIILSPATQNITDGQLDFFVWWRPLSSNGNLALGANLTAI